MTLMSPIDVAAYHAETGYAIHPGRTIRQTHKTMRSITEEVAHKYGIPVHEIMGRDKSTHLVWARWEIWHRIKSELWTPGSERYSLAAIGRHFGKHHTTVIHGLKKYAAWLEDQARLDSGEVVS